MKTIYFCGSIRGGRENATTYQKMIHHIQQNHNVLTEHIGNTNLNTNEQTYDKDKHIYTTDINLLNQADLLIAECTIPSLGVGYELCYLEQKGKPVHIFYNPTKCNLSAMIKGNNYFHLYPYTNEEELFTLLDELLKTL